MKTFNAKRMLLAVAVLGFGIFASIDSPQSGGLALSIQSAEARVGRPATPVALPALRVEQRAGRSWEERLSVPQLQARLASAFL